VAGLENNQSQAAGLGALNPGDGNGNGDGDGDSDGDSDNDVELTADDGVETGEASMDMEMDTGIDRHGDMLDLDVDDDAK